MSNLIIENKKDKMVLRLNKKGFDENYLISLVKRLQIEELAQKSGFTQEVLDLAEEIKQEWWLKNEDEFLSGILR
ncbi:MAG: hypothetical protein GX876_04210 [Bacteroidales bacterium]|nr:hypothetical protein [Bacteroidales bacterium]